MHIYACMYVNNATSILNTSSQFCHLPGVPFQVSLATHQLFAVTIHLSVLPIQLFTRKPKIFPGSINLSLLPNYFLLHVKMTQVLMQ